MGDAYLAALYCSLSEASNNKHGKAELGIVTRSDENVTVLNDYFGQYPYAHMAHGLSKTMAGSSSKSYPMTVALGCKLSNVQLRSIQSATVMMQQECHLIRRAFPAGLDHSQLIEQQGQASRINTSNLP
jgi:hypothetical protein